MAANVWVVFLLLIPAALLAAWLYHPKKQPVPFLLRTLAFFALFLFLLNPSFTRLKERTVRPGLYILADNSLSVQAYDRLIDSMAETVSGEPAIRQHFHIHRYYFDDSVYAKRPSRHGSRTDIYQALEYVAHVPDEEASKTVVLFTDGISNRGKDYELFPQDYPGIRIFPVVTGDTTFIPNVRIERVDYNPTVTTGNYFTVKTVISAYPLHKPVELQVNLRQNNRIVAARRVRLTPEKNFSEIPFKLRAGRPGLYAYEITAESLPGERQLRDNRQKIWINVVDNTARILIKTGKIHPDAGALKRVLSRNQHYKINIQHQFPENLSGYDLIIALQPQAKDVEILSKIDKPVWWITGIHTDWDAVNRASLLFSRQTQGSLTEEYFPAENPAFDLFDLKPLPSFSLPPLKDKFGNVRLHAPAEIIYYARIKQHITDQPLLAVFPDRKQAVLFGQGLWKWWMTEKKHGDTSHLEDVVNKTVAFLISKTSRNQLVVHHEDIYPAGTHIRWKISAFNKLMEPNPSARLRFYLRYPGDSIRQIPVYYNEPYFMADIGHLPPGTYRYEIIYDDYNLRKKGGFTVETVSPEQPGRAKKETLETLAQASGGQLFFPDRIENLMEVLKDNEKFPFGLKEEKQHFTLLDRKIWLFLFALLMALEWIYRKYRGWL